MLRVYQRIIRGAMNHDVTRIVDRYIHRYLATIFQLDYQEKFGQFWNDEQQYFGEDFEEAMAMYRRYRLGRLWDY